MPSRLLPKRLQTWLAARSRVARLGFWMSALFAVSLCCRILGVLSGWAVVGIVISSTLLACVAIILLWRWWTRRVLWKVRNRLIVTYVLMGLAPLVLFATLTSIAAYIFAGQFATDVASFQFQQAYIEVHDQAVSVANYFAQRAEPSAASMSPFSGAHSGVHEIAFATLRNGSWQTASKSLGPKTDAAESPFAGQSSPSWLHPGFQGIVAYKGTLYVCSVAAAAGSARPATVLASMPVDGATLDWLAADLGRLYLMPGFGFGVGSPGEHSNDPHPGTNFEVDDGAFDSVSGGTLRNPLHFYDTRVYFSAPLAISAWNDGGHVRGGLGVVSRPTLLYSRLFGTSIQTGWIVRTILISIAVTFTLLELFALLMALRLSRTITRSVAELYEATTAIDRGNLEHRVLVKRQDQLGALANSFNRMAGSLGRLLEKEREQQRLLSELAVAQEVQNSLFPRSPVSRPHFEMHGVCVPARVVSGDYFDFIFGEGDNLCLALGDISGKGISAALLMASLHSAVRAFSMEEHNKTGAQPSPARLLELLNRHLYANTQPAKYATLFLAFYDSSRGRLTYSNAGHLPPLLLSPDGNVQPLDCGGTVVGLLDGPTYSEATVQLRSGDLLMAYSDGLTEPENHAIEFGQTRLLECIRQNRDKSLSVIVAETFKTLQNWIGDSEQPDDMTLLLVRHL